MNSRRLVACVLLITGSYSLRLAWPVNDVRVEQEPNQGYQPVAAGSASPINEGAIEIQLCECESAMGYPHGLGCDKEGWFISNFENQGTWMGGGGLVPLSHAICCRPCLPGELPAYALAAHERARAANNSAAPDRTPTAGINNSASAETTSSTAAGAGAGAANYAKRQLTRDVMQHFGAREGPDTKPVAVVSIGCHPASGRGYKALQCESNGPSFITGFSAAERVSSYYFDVYYPVGQAECCTPAVLLSTGDVWEIKRCGCVQSQTKDCGGLTTNKLLWGFAQWRVTRSGEYLPVAPLECCSLCMGDTIHDATNCKDLGFCNNNGICVLGSCQCFEGFGGPDCTITEHDGTQGPRLPWWATALIIMASVLLMSASSFVMKYAYRMWGEETYGQAPSGMHGSMHGHASAQTPLLLGLDDAGSAGSHDTDEEEEEEEGSGEGADASGDDSPERLASGSGHGPTSRLLPAHRRASGSMGHAPRGRSRTDADGSFPIMDPSLPNSETMFLMDDVAGSAGGLLGHTPGGAGSSLTHAGCANGNGTILENPEGERAALLAETGAGVVPAPGALLAIRGLAEASSEGEAGTTAGSAPLPRSQRTNSTAGSESVLVASLQGRSAAVGKGRRVAMRSTSAEAGLDSAGAGAEPGVGTVSSVRTCTQANGGGTAALTTSSVNSGSAGSSASEPGVPERVCGGLGLGTEVAGTQVGTNLSSVGGVREDASYTDLSDSVSDAELKGVGGDGKGQRAAGAQGLVPLSNALCAVCMEKPIQVALVPCGHANVCRHCSRRMTSCPMCRKVILRRQRLYYCSG